MLLDDEFEVTQLDLVQEIRVFQISLLYQAKYNYQKSLYHLFHHALLQAEQSAMIFSLYASFISNGCIIYSLGMPFGLTGSLRIILPVNPCQPSKSAESNCSKNAVNRNIKISSAVWNFHNNLALIVVASAPVIKPIRSASSKESTRRSVIIVFRHTSKASYTL